MTRRKSSRAATDPAVAARGLMRRGRSAALATRLAEGGGAPQQGWPYASLVTVAVDLDATPILLLSELADHTRNLVDDSRASLLFEEASRRRNPQTGARVTVLGRIEKTDHPRHARRFLARHPDAALYAGFKDFHFYVLRAERARFVGGFGRARWIEGRDLLLQQTEVLAEAEPAIVEHMNRNHAATAALYAQKLLGRRGANWFLTGVDPEGADLRSGMSFARLAFSCLIRDADMCRTELVRLANAARNTVSKGTSG